MSMTRDEALLPAAHAITPSDHGGVVIVTTATCMIVVSLFLLARLVLRWPMTSGLYSDDAVIIGATVSRADRRETLDEDVIAEH